jgi:hypothetical protein
VSEQWQKVHIVNYTPTTRPMSKKRDVRVYENEDDEDQDDDDMPAWSFNQAVPAPRPTPSFPVAPKAEARSCKRPLTRVVAVTSKYADPGDDDDDDDFVDQSAWDSLPRGGGSSAPLPLLPNASGRKHQVPPSQLSSRKVANQPDVLMHVNPELIDSLSTYDKPERSAASPDTRHTHLFNRVHRAREKVQEAAASGRPPDSVDDSLMRDVVGTYLQDYRQHSDYKTSERVLPSLPSHHPPPPPAAAAAAPPSQPRPAAALPRMVPLPPPFVRGIIPKADIGDDDDDDDMEGDEDVDPYVRLAVSGWDDSQGANNDDDDEDNDQDDMASRMFVAPMRRVPDQANTQIIQTFSEYTGPSSATGQFTDNIRHVKGRERGVHMEIRDADELYPVVSETMIRPLANMAIERLAVERGVATPDPPVVSKAEIQDGLHAPNPALGERPCLRSVRCASWKMCLYLMQHMPERYKNARPFVCKEFYFGDRGAEVQAALREGRPLAEVQTPELVMCVMCHLKIVTKWYKKCHAGLVLEPPHILHSFQVTAGVPGGYPIDKCLMGDKVFCGIMAPFLRHVPNNYVWKSSSGVAVRDQATGRMVVREGPAIQCWLERDCMDFQ